MSGRDVSTDTNSSQRRELVYPMQHGRECCVYLNKLIIPDSDWPQLGGLAILALRGALKIFAEYFR